MSITDFLYNTSMILGTFGTVFGLGYASMWVAEKIADWSER